MAAAQPKPYSRADARPRLLGTLSVYTCDPVSSRTVLIFFENVESIIKCRRNRYGFSCIIFLSEGRRKEVKTLNGYSYLTLEQRREIERMYAEGERVVDIAARLKRSAAAIYEELKRGYTGEFDGYARPKYSADLAQATVQENFRRRGNRRGANC